MFYTITLGYLIIFLIRNYFISLLCFIASLILYIIYKRRIIIISVDGNIGSGKSTLIKFLKKKYKNITVVDEPVNQWLSILDSDSKNILQKFYEGSERYSYTFQNFAFITRSMNLIDKINSLKYKLFLKKVIITERSVETDKNIFAKMLFDTNQMTLLEYNMYNYWYEKLFPEVKIKNIIYLKTSPDIAFERIKKRNRIEEKDVTKEYIDTVHDYHEKWLNNKKYSMCILDGNIENYKLHEKNIIKYIQLL